MSSVVHANGTFYIEEEPPKHRCLLPVDEEQWPDGFNPDYWECSVCSQVYSITISAWTGWWSLDTDVDTERGTNDQGFPTIFCKWETYVDCPPNILFEPLKPNNTGTSGIHVSHPNPGPRPDWLPPLPQNRRLAKQRWTTSTGPSRREEKEALREIASLEKNAKSNLPEANLPWIDRIFGRR